MLGSAIIDVVIGLIHRVSVIRATMKPRSAEPTTRESARDSPVLAGADGSPRTHAENESDDCDDCSVDCDDPTPDEALPQAAGGVR